MVEESIGERESKKFVEGLYSKVKLTLYKTFSKVVQFKMYMYLHGLQELDCCLSLDQGLMG